MSGERREGRQRKAAPHGTRDHILNVAAGLFGQYGFDGVSIRQIATATGTNLGAVTYHFGGKEELYRATIRALTDDIETYLAPFLQALRDRVAQAGHDRAALREAARMFIDDWARQTLSNADVQKRMPVLARELIAPSEAFETIFAGFYLQLGEVFSELLAATTGLERGSVDLKVRVHALSSLMLSFVSNEKVLWRLLGWDGYSADRVAQLLPALTVAFLDAAGLGADQADGAGA